MLLSSNMLIEVLPTAIVANTDTPPKLEICFDMEPWAFLNVDVILFLNRSMPYHFDIPTPTVLFFFSRCEQ